MSGSEQLVWLRLSLAPVRESKGVLHQALILEPGGRLPRFHYRAQPLAGSRDGRQEGSQTGVGPGRAGLGVGGEGLQTHCGTSAGWGIHPLSACLLSVYYVLGTVPHAVETMEGKLDLVLI